MAPPISIQDWLGVARERASDAEAILTNRPDSTGSVYLVGYAIECSLKAYLLSIGRPVPTSGRAGHNITGMWDASGFRKRDIGDTDGCKVFFLEDWDTSMRYSSVRQNGGITNQQLIEGAKRLVGWVQGQVRREGMRRKRK